MLLLLLAATLPVWAQRDVEEGDDAFRYGYYNTAIEYYMKAYRTSPTPTLAYKIAESHRLSNGYAEAVRYYSIVAESSQSNFFPHCDYFLASMHRNNGHADSALYYYQRYLSGANNEELERRARQESRACQWVLDSLPPQEWYSVSRESRNINTEFSESGAMMMGDSLLLFSSMREVASPGSRDAINTDFILTQIYQADFAHDGTPNKAQLNTWGLNSKEKQTCNVAYDPIHQSLYFTLCESNDFTDIPCEIYVSHFEKGRWQKARKLPSNVNLPSYSNTHPAVGFLADSTVVLYFSSNRPGGVGGYDIWYSLIRPGHNPSDPVNLGQPVNSVGNEITPFYDMERQRLCFSSDWHLGYGGYDIFYSEGQRDSWQQPVNMGASLNSPANDLYFTVNGYDGESGYLTSNRPGSLAQHGTTCCNDIYSWQRVEAPQPAEPEKEEAVAQVLRQKSAIHHLLPIKLYFHNDEPDPKSKLATTTTNYFQTYNRYMFMRRDYINAHTAAVDQERRDSICDAIDYFFDYDVQYNCERFEEFLDLLLEDLRAGHRISMTVEGYASPIHTSAYNELISKRRIASIVNQIMEYKKGILTRFMGSNGGSLQIREMAYGSSRAAGNVSADRGSTDKSVYSVEAAKERRIEILDYQYMEDDSSLISCLHLPSRAIHIGTYFIGEYADIEIHLPHEAVNETALDFISVGNPDVQVVGYSKLTPGHELVLYLRMNNRRAEPVLSAFLPITLRVAGEQVTQTMFVEYTLERD